MAKVRLTKGSLDNVAVAGCRWIRNISTKRTKQEVMSLIVLTFAR